MAATDATARTLRGLVTRLRAAVTDLLSQEFSYSSGYLAAMLNCCLFAPSLLTFWFVNGLIDFSTAVAIGAVASPAGLQVRLVVYLLLVPVFLALRAAIHMAHPAHRRQLLQGACPNARYLSLDWFSVGVLATGLPLAVRDLGPWLGMNAVFLVGIFLLPRVLDGRPARAVTVAAVVAGTGLFLYANYGGVVAVLPHPAAVVGPVATLVLPDSTVTDMLRVVNSLLVGPFVVAGVGAVMNRVLTRPELTDIPVVRHSLPRRDPDDVVVVSTAIGTVIYLLVAALATGHLLLVP